MSPFSRLPSHNSRRGITLLEMLVVVALISMLYLMVSYTTVQLSRASRNGTAACLARQERLHAVEQLRWQLRCLFIPEGGSCLKGGRLPGTGEDIVSLLSSAGGEHDGVVEATYRVMGEGDTDGHSNRYLAYREFRTRSALGLRPWTDQEEAVFHPLDKRVKAIRLDYSVDGKVFQREWDANEPPKAIRVLITDHDDSTFTFTVIPGVGSARW